VKSRQIHVMQRDHPPVPLLQFHAIASGISFIKLSLKRKWPAIEQ